MLPTPCVIDSARLTSATAGDTSGKGGTTSGSGGCGTTSAGLGFPEELEDPSDRQTLRRELELSDVAGGGV